MIARMSLIIVVSACPMDLNPVGGQGITDLEITVTDTEEEIQKSFYQLKEEKYNSLILEMCAGPVPQQPPTTLAPACSQRPTYSA